MGSTCSRNVQAPSVPADAVLSPSSDPEHGRLKARLRETSFIDSKEAEWVRLHPEKEGKDGLFYYPPQLSHVPLLVFFHGAKQTSTFARDLLKSMVAELGLAVLAIDSREESWDLFTKRRFAEDRDFLDTSLSELFATYSFDPHRLAVGGFSDGATYALSVGLLNGDLFTHVLAFSPGRLFHKVESFRGKPQVFITHGTRDEVLPIDGASRQFVPYLQKHDVKLSYVEFEGDHSIPHVTLLHTLESALGTSSSVVHLRVNSSPASPVASNASSSASSSSSSSSSSSTSGSPPALVIPSTPGATNPPPSPGPPALFSHVILPPSLPALPGALQTPEKRSDCTFFIRRATQEDTAAILRCLALAFAPYKSYYTAEAFTDTTLNEEKITQRLKEMAMFVAVRCVTPSSSASSASSASGVAAQAESKEDVVGTIGYRLVDEKEAHIRGMGLLPDCEGSGVGKLLLQHVEAEVRKEGRIKLSLDTTAPLQRAISFYVRNGFRASGVVGDFFGLQLFEYVKDLSPELAKIEE